MSLTALHGRGLPAPIRRARLPALTSLTLRCPPALACLPAAWPATRPAAPCLPASRPQWSSPIWRWGASWVRDSRCAVPLVVASAPALCTCPDASSPAPLLPSQPPSINTTPRLCPLPTVAAGDGASGEVFEARWRGQRVAVKIFVQDRSPDGHSRDEMAIAFAGEGLPGVEKRKRHHGGPEYLAQTVTSCVRQFMSTPDAYTFAPPCSVGAAPGAGAGADAGPSGAGPGVC